VHYEQADVFWECRELYASASFPTGTANFPKSNPFSVDKYATGARNLDPSFHWEAPTNFLTSLLTSNSKSNSDHWLKLIESYSRLALTYPDDRLPGIAAIARRMNERFFRDRYVAGYFESQLPVGLLFSFEGAKPRPGKYIAPTWSWAAADGPVTFTRSNKYFAKGKPIAKVKSICVDLVNPGNEYGQLKSASITIEAPVLRLKFDQSLWEKYSPPSDQRLRLNKAGKETLNVPRQATLQINWDYAQNTHPSELMILHIWQECGILLMPRQTCQDADSHSPRFERVGTWQYYCGRGRSFREFRQLHGMDTIIIV
jgi:hypothetical protein